MIEVYRIPVSKDRLASMPSEERVAFLLIGYVSNQVTMLQKLLTVSANDRSADALAGACAAVQTQMLARLMVGALNEAWKALETRFIKSRIAPRYIQDLDEDGIKALEALKTQFRQPNLLNKVRNNFAFHHPESGDVEKAFNAARADPGLDEHWAILFSHHGYNSLFLFSDLIFIHGIRESANETELGTLQDRMLSEMLNASENFTLFAKAFTKAVWLKHFGTSMDCDRVLKIEDAPKMDDVSLPFFFQIVERE